MNDSNGIRLQGFCQFKKEIRGSTDYLIVGLDIAKERHNVFFGTATGKTLHKGMFFDNTYEGFQKLLIQTDALKVQYGLRKVVFGLEPTANYHKPLGEYLIKGGHLVVLVSAAATVKNRELLDDGTRPSMSTRSARRSVAWDQRSAHAVHKVRYRPSLIRRLR